MYKVEVRQPTIKPVGGALPEMEELDAVFKSQHEFVEEQMKDEAATPIDILSAYSKSVMAEWYVGNGPKGLNLGNNVCCHGAGVNVTTYRAYFMEQRAARSPENFRARYGHYPRIFMREKGRTYDVHVMKGDRKAGLGRAGGTVGWDKTRDLFAFALASFRHNFQALLGAFASRPKLPCTEEWHLPNLVHSKYVRDIERRYGCDIVDPPVAVPPASYTFSLTLPSPMLVLAVGTNCPKDVTTYCEFWDANKKDLVEPFKVTFPKGESVTIITLRAVPPALVQKGYFNINPVNSEMTVSHVRLLVPTA